MRDGGKTSEDVLIQWMTTGSNYLRWKGGASTGDSKENICSEIVAALAMEGITHRTNCDVRNKIGDLEQAHRIARDWLKLSGEGIRASDVENGEMTIQMQLKRRCKHWDTLDPLMRERPSTRPLYTNEDDESDLDYQSAAGSDLQATEFSQSTEPSALLSPSPSPLHRSPASASRAATPSPSPIQLSPTSSISSKGTQSVMAMWRETQQISARLEERRLVVEEQRLAMDKRKSDLEIEMLRYDAEIKRMRLLEARAQAWQQMIASGIDENAIDELLATSNGDTELVE